MTLRLHAEGSVAVTCPVPGDTLDARRAEAHRIVDALFDAMQATEPKLQ